MYIQFKKAVRGTVSKAASVGVKDSETNKIEAIVVIYANSLSLYLFLGM